jgi:hypothetical protein
MSRCRYSNVSGNRKYTTGITYSLDGPSRTAGNTINAASGTVTYVAGWSGTSIVTASAAGCYGLKLQSYRYHYAYSRNPAFTLGATSARCQIASTVAYTATATNTTAITYSLDAAGISSGNTINASTGDVTYAAGMGRYYNHYSKRCRLERPNYKLLIRYDQSSCYSSRVLPRVQLYKNARAATSVKLQCHKHLYYRNNI